MDLSNQAAIVTGGASGLGAATAEALAEGGVRVAILDRDAAAAEAIAARIGGIAAPCDVSDGPSVEAALTKAASAHGPARIVVNCAGVGTAVGEDLDSLRQVATCPDPPGEWRWISTSGSASASTSTAEAS